MKKVFIRFLIIAFLLDSCTSVYVEVPPFGRYIHEEFAGIVHAGETNTAEEFEYLEYMGVKLLLHTFYWDRIEPQQGEWHFQDYDNMVNNANDADMLTVGVLAYDNRWIHDDGKLRKYIPQERIPDFLEYVRRTVDHFRGRVYAWCIWNEPNFYFWTGTDREFINLFNQTAAVVKETDSNVILLGGGFNRNIPGLKKKFINEIFSSDGMKYIDAVAFHPYELNFNRSLRIFEKFSEIAEKYGYKDKIWITEIGFPTGGWYPARIKEKELPEFIIKTCTLLAAGGAKKVLWYHMFDPVKRSGSNSEDFFGLVRSNQDYTSKGAEAFRLCSLFMPDSMCYAQVPGKDYMPSETPKSVKTFWFKKQEGSALILWNGRAGIKKIHLDLPGTNHLLHDIVSGSTTSILPEIVIPVGNEPLFITWQDIYDFEGQ
ncbi:MAG: endo-1,4-beta-xylanase [Treponema sp.]|nr:endo-1,4-beta-xylanase [Treponema sp.]MCL2273128.1 endo-1,4-beta-xylanase [Treponema sp.]